VECLNVAAEGADFWAIFVPQPIWGLLATFLWV
jgi:hypothetical protein